MLISVFWALTPCMMKLAQFEQEKLKSEISEQTHLKGMLAATFIILFTYAIVSFA